MSDTPASDALISRLRKLMALAENNTNQHEAEAAAAKVQSLLAQHNIEMSQIDKDTQAGPVHEVRPRTAHQRSAMYTYQQKLMSQIAKLNFCLYFTEEQRRVSNGKMRKVKTHVLLGRAVNITGSILMYDYLVDTADRILPYTGMEKRGKDALAWLDGFTAAVSARLEERRTEDTAASDAKRAAQTGAVGGNQMVLSEVYSSEADLNNDAMHGYEPGHTARRRARWKAEEAAREAASKARIEAQAAEWAAKEADLIEDGEDPTTAYYIARGLPVPGTIAVASETPPVRPESASARARREAAEQRASDAYWNRRDRQERAAQAKLNNPAYKAGKSTGQQVGLDRQINRTDTKRIG